MCSRTYYLIIGTLSFPPLLHRGDKVRYNFSFTLPYKHVWTLSYIYRVLISPIDKSSEQRNDKTKPKHSIFHAVNSSFSGEPESGQTLRSAKLSVRPCRDEGSLHCGKGPPPTTCPDLLFQPFSFPKSNQNRRKSIYFVENISQVCSNSTKTNHRD